MTKQMIVNPALRRRRLEERHPRWEPRTLSGALDAAAAFYGERPFVITDDRAYSYRDIQERSRRLATGLLAIGVTPGDHVALVMGNFAEFVALRFAIARVGAAAVPINYLLRRAELSYVLEQSNARVLITMDRLREIDYLDELDSIAPRWEDGAGGDSLPRLRSIFVFPTGGDSTRPGARGLTELEEAGSGIDVAELKRRERAGDPSSCSDVIYTSGTTGHPKGVLLTHDMVLRTAYASAYTRAFEDGRRILFSLPMYHVFGYIECFVATMFVGGAIIPHVLFDPERMLEAAERHRASEIACVPTMTLQILEKARERNYDLESLTAVFSSGGASLPSLWEDIRATLGAQEVLTGYGMTETTASTACTLPEDPADRLMTNGRLKQAGVAGDRELDGLLAVYKTVDPESHSDLPAGMAGEFVVRGPIVTPGYYEKPDETRAAFDEDGWFRTGDVGFIDEHGYVYLTGRIKETYRCGGEMVMPSEVEAVLSEHPKVTQALVVGVSHERMGEVGCAFIVVASDQQVEPEALIEFCAARLARFKVPRHILFIGDDEIPLTTTGRVRKFQLVELARRRLPEEPAATRRRELPLEGAGSTSRTSFT